MSALVVLSGIILAAWSAGSNRLTRLPPSINPFARQELDSSSARAHVLSDVSAAVKLALDAGSTLLEVEFPPLIGSKSQFDDYSNIEHLNANRDFAFELVPRLGLGGELLVCLLDDTECELARKAYPGAAYSSASAMALSAAAQLYSGRQAGPFAWFTSAIAALGPGKAPAASMAKALRLVVQPCEEGRVDDWLNMELLNEGAGRDVPIVCLNGYLDKQRSGYYPAWQFPDVTRCGAEFLSRFDAAYFLKAYSVKGRLGWVLRAYGEPWQLLAQEREGASLLETYESRPSYEQVRDRLLQGGSSR